LPASNCQQSTCHNSQLHNDISRKYTQICQHQNISLNTKISLYNHQDILCCHPKIPIGLYHYPWFIFFIALHCISFLVLYCIFCCTVHYCLFSFLIFSLLATSSIN